MSGSAGVVTFDQAAWLTRYPELARFGVENMASAFFVEACGYLDNTAASVVQDLGMRAMLLNMLVAHIAALNVPADDPDIARIVGRLTSANTGSAGVSTELAMPGSFAWFTQTRYGAAFAQLVRPFVTGGRYYGTRRPIAAGVSFRGR